MQEICPTVVIVFVSHILSSEADILDKLRHSKQSRFPVIYLMAPAAFEDSRYHWASPELAPAWRCLAGGRSAKVHRPQLEKLLS